VEDGFLDHFSGQAAEYAAFRPVYPAALIDWLACTAPSRGLAWDCGTGNGQAAVMLADRFDAVLATDASPAQIAAAPPHPRVTYRVAREDESGAEPASVDLVTAAQALHWFDRPRFYAEAARVLKPDGVLAVWCYNLARISPAIDSAVTRFYAERVGRYWPPERREVETEYRAFDLPFGELPVPSFVMTAQLTREAFVAYVGTWSAVARARREEQQDPLPDLVSALTPIWPVAQLREVAWPLAVRAARRPVVLAAGALGH
jgi:SAM-dependent methyltransferase